MKYKRRDFIQDLGKVGLSTSFLMSCTDGSYPTVNNKINYSENDPEAYWQQMRNQYVLHEDLVYLNNAGAQPIAVFNAYLSYLEDVNKAPSFVLFLEYAKKIKSIRGSVATLLDCLESEVALTRNATEALLTIIFGLNLSAGDEIITTTRDYPTVLQGLHQRSNRNGIIIKKIIPEVPLSDEEILLNQIESGITSKTKLIIVSHIEFVTGAILPVQKICELAHKKGVEVMVDGAQSLGQIDLSIKDIGCDYFAASLHKWLSAPIGTGVLFIKKDKIKNVWPLFADDEKDPADINKFTHLGTRDLSALLAVQDAIDFHQSIGIERKQARLNMLTQYLDDKLKIYQQIKLNTPRKNSCGILNLSIKGIPLGELSRSIKKARIYVSIMRHENARGIRVSPNIFTTFHELDLLIETIEELMA